MRNFTLTMVTFMALAALSLGVSAQSISTFPYTQDFEIFSTCGTSCSSNCTMNPASAGWTANTGTNSWAVDIGGTSSSNTGPSTDHNPGTSTGKYLYTESSGCAGTARHLQSPYFNFTGMNAPVVEFWYHMFGGSMGTMHFDVDTSRNPGSPTWVLDVIPSWTDNLNAWQQRSVTLTGFGNKDSVRIRVRGITGTSYQSDMAVDDFKIFQPVDHDAAIGEIVNPSIPFCPNTNPTTVVIDNAGSLPLDSVMVNWTVNGVAQPAFNYIPTTPIASGSSSAPVNIGTYSYLPGDNLKVWTDMPNGVADQNNGNDTTSLALVSGLSGTYTIGGTNPDYADFSSALADINMLGACGSVVFNVRDGIYNEQLVLQEFPGASPMNTVTFQSESGDSTLVTLNFNSTSTSTTINFVINMDEGDYYRFHQLTIDQTGSSAGRALYFPGGADNNKFTNCIISGSGSATSTSTTRAVIYSNTGSDHGNEFSNNVIDNGSYGMYWFGASTANLETGTVIMNNDITNMYYRGLYLASQDAPNISYNRASIITNYCCTIYVIYCSSCENDMQIVGNYCETDNYGYGIWAPGCDGTPVRRGLIANNMIIVGDSTSSSTSYGLYVSSSTFQQIAYNSVNLHSDGSNSRAAYFTGGGLNTAHNNSFVNNGPGYAVYSTNALALTESNYNNLYAPNGNVGYGGGSARATLADWQMATGLDANSLSVDPGYQSGSDLHSCSSDLDGAATPLSYVMYDFDHDMRSTTAPDIGADEFASPNGFAIDAGGVAGLCPGDTVTLSVSAPGASVLWSTQETTPSIEVSMGGTYTVGMAGACGVAADSVTLDSYPMTVVDLGADTSICEMTNITLDAGNPGGTYQWSTGATTQMIQAAQGTYTVVVNDTNGCEGFDQIVVGENPNPMVDLGPDTAACRSYTIDAGNAGSTYLWNTGETTQMITVLNSGRYTVMVTDANGCMADGLVFVDVNANPEVDLGPDTTVCDGITLDAGKFNRASYLWDDGSTMPTRDVTASGTYYVEVVDGNSCAGTDTVVVAVNASPSVDLGPDVIMQDSVTLDAGAGGSSYLWSTGDTTQTIVVKTTGVYSVVVTGAGGCTGSDEIFVLNNTAIDELLVSNFAVFPNPSNGHFTLRFDQDVNREISVSIYDVTGRELMNSAHGSFIGSFEESYDLSTQPNGVYLLKVSSDSQSKYTKIIKQ